jgi:hypothetical protein
VTFKLSTGETFCGHRIVFCAQSSVFKAMLCSSSGSGSGGFKETEEKEILLPEISAKTMNFLLRYLYLGECAVLDVNQALDLMAVAARFVFVLFRVCRVFFLLVVLI